MSKLELLFSYGTLQNVDVQIATFGRELKGKDDALLGYRLAMLEIKDMGVTTLSGEKHHPIAVETCHDSDEVLGKVFEITAKELEQSDNYEVSEYKRVRGKLKSGKNAWVYVSASDNACT